MIQICDGAHILLRFLSNVGKGFVTFRRGGNCKGLDVLVLDEDDLYDQTLTDNPIGFGLLPEDDEGNEWFKMTLTNDNGDELSVEDT